MAKKIAFVTKDFADKNFSSGGLKLDCMLVKELLKNDYDVEVFAQNYHSEITTPEFKTYKFEEFEEFKSRKNYDFVLSSYAIYPADITYIHDHTNIFRFAKMHTPLYRLLDKYFNRKAYKKRFDADTKQKEVLEGTKKIIVSSEILKQDYVKSYGLEESKFEILPPPVIIERTIRPKSDPETFVFGLSAIGFERKGGYVALKAAARIKNSKKNFKLKIIYPKRNPLIKLLIALYGLGNNVELLDCQNDMNRFYNEIDCLLMPSKVEPYGMVTTEALMLGKPVILSNISGASDIIKSGYNGFVVDDSRHFSKNLSVAMKEILEMPAEGYEKLSANALDSVKGLDISDFLRKYLEIINKIEKKA